MTRVFVFLPGPRYRLETAAGGLANFSIHPAGLESNRFQVTLQRLVARPGNFSMRWPGSCGRCRQRPGFRYPAATAMGLPTMQFRWVILITLWTMLAGPIFAPLDKTASTPRSVQPSVEHREQIANEE